jgi:hypothetical protein
VSPSFFSDASAADRLLDRLRGELGEPSLRYVEAPTRLSAARFSAVRQCRVTPPLPVLGGRLIIRSGNSAHQVRLEAGLHRGVAAQDAGIAAPTVVLVETDPAVLGAPFIVMEHIDGSPTLSSVAPVTFACALPRLLRRWPRQLVSIAHALAAVDIRPVVTQLVDGDAEHRAQPGHHLRNVAKVLDGVVGLEELIGWMLDHEPTVERPVLSHGDLWPTNVFDRSDRTTLIDWNRGGLDHPALDIGFAAAGFALMPEPFPPPGPVASLARGVGQLMANRIVERCAPVVGGVERIRYYEALRCLVEIADATADPDDDESGWASALPRLVAHASAATGIPARL